MVDKTSEVPHDFPLREQLEEIRSVYKSRKDFIDGTTRKRTMGDEERNLLVYSLKRIEAIGRTLAWLVDEQKAGRMATLPSEPKPLETKAAQVEENSLAVDDGWDDE